jgi:hypothetical protein
VCREHVEELLELRIPTTAEFADDGAWSVRKLIDARALDVRPTRPDERWMRTEGERIGPLQWTLWLGDESRILYDDGAPLALDDALRAQQGVSIVEWEDREVFWIGAARMCRSGVMAAAARALSDARVRGA